MKLYNSTQPCPETGKPSRNRNRFNNTQAERSYMKKLTVAKALRKLGTRYSAEFMARNSTLGELRSKYNYVTGCIRSV